ncbi:hypothetical protein KFU94_47670 [Chloroflexi bacterium TSY]|nr:hypothetical protein [Chloroflexi bacterium TSY]
MRVELHGYTGLKHHSRIYLNEHEIDDLAWWGQKPFTHVVNVLPQFLRNGENVLRVETVDTGAAVDQILVNWVELDYWDTYTAEDSQLWFRSEIAGIGQFEIAGLSDQNVMLLDITDVRRPTRITNPAVVDQGGRYAVRFEVSTQPGRRYYVTTLSRAKSPAALLLDQPSRWRAATHGADYIIITSQEFYRSALVLAEHRQASGLRVATIIVDDLYDEFTHGLFSPRAIRRFLQYTYENWQTPAPTYVLLFGDANQDYKDNFKTGAVNYVPSYNMDSSLFGEVSSDNWFVAVNGDDQLPDMFIGRLVAQNQAEAQVMVEKIIQYEQNPASDGWERNVLHVADIGTKFERIAEDLAAHLPSDYVVSRVYANDYQSSTAGVSATTDIVDRINQGSVLVTYIGHGNFASWGRSQIGFVFGTSNVDALNNGERLPVVVVGNCLNGFFAGAKESPSLAEVLQRRKAGGAIAVWAPSGLGYPDDHAVLLHEFYRAMFADSSQTIGAATTAAKLAIFAGNQHRRELVETYVLFGDPALRLARAPDHQYQARITK